MEHVPFVFSDRASVPGYIGFDVQDELLSHIIDLKPDKVLVVTDNSVDALHGEYLAPLSLRNRSRGETGGDAITFGEKCTSDDMSDSDDKSLTSKMGGTKQTAQVDAICDVSKFVVPCGDACKSWDALSSLIKWAFEIGATKRSLIVAFGGGAVLNLTGLFASILFRGTKCIYIPTTFLAMHDVVTSMKTSICFDGRKNNIGSFFAPTKILIEAAFCQTLPRNELFSGLGELAKNAALFGGEHADGFTEALSSEEINGQHGGSGEEFVLDGETLRNLLTLGIKAKMDVLLVDPYERTHGMVFEYGHTVSHALEKAYGDGIIPHGLGVVYGMLSSSYAAEQMGIMTKTDRESHDAICNLLVHRWSLPEPRPTADLVMELGMRDSKRGITCEGESEISDVLLRKVGDVVKTPTNNLSKFANRYVYEWLIDMGFPTDGSFNKLQKLTESL